MAGTTTNNIIELRDVRPVPDQPAPYSVALYGNAALIIDNGSYQCRAGWSTAARPALEFRNLIAKPRRDRNKKETAAEAAAAAANPPPIQVGNEIVNIEAMRFQLKSQFDRNVVTHSHNSEQIFDYVLRNLSVEGATDGGCPHAIVLTEPLANPNYSRQLMSELLFECYAVPKVAFGVDALFGFAHQQPTDAATATANNGDGLILSFGYHTTHVIPVLAGRPVHSRARRLNLGGAQMTNYLHRLLQLKYPVHTAAITLSRAEWLLHEHCSVAVDYGAALGRWRGLEHYEQHVKKVQLPFSMPAASATSALTAEQRVERRRETAKRLSDMNARRREEKLVEDELVLQRLVALRELWDDGDREEFEYACGQMEIAGHAELEKQIQQVLAKVHRTKAKISAANESGAAAAAAAAAQAADAAAAGAGDATGQPPLPAGGHPAVRVDAIVMVIPQPPDQLSIGDWVRQMRGRRSDILGRRAARRQRRLDLARRRTAAAQERMRVITQLARKEKGVDDFGARDEDWDVYKTIRRETGDSDSEVEQEKLQECEEVLRHHDPEFERTAGPGGAGAGGGGGAAGASGAGNAAMNPMLGAGNPAELYQVSFDCVISFKKNTIAFRCGLFVTTSLYLTVNFKATTREPFGGLTQTCPTRTDHCCGAARSSSRSR